MHCSGCGKRIVPMECEYILPIVKKAEAATVWAVGTPSTDGSIPYRMISDRTITKTFKVIDYDPNTRNKGSTEESNPWPSPD